MPEMDGYQATAKLRSDPRFASLPIVAMTAHATIEERERCLAAGMVDHVAKPIDPSALIDTVARWMDPASLPTTRSGAETKGRESAASTPLDEEDGLRRVGGNRQLYAKLVRRFVEEQRSAVESIAAAIERDELTLAARIAHTLKGVAGNIGAKPVHSAAGEVEKRLRDQAETAEVKRALDALKEALDPLIARLSDRRNPTIPEDAAQTAPPALPTSKSTAPARAAAERLTALLHDSDPDAADFLAANRTELEPLFEEGAWPEFECLVQEYAFSEALARLEQALATP